MSKLRQDPSLSKDAELPELATPAEGDLVAYVVFTRLKEDGPYVYAGWLDAADDAMALTFAREHYGQDQQCVGIWAARREHLAGTHLAHQAAAAPGAPRDFQIFAQERSGEPHVSAGTVEAASAPEAVEIARRTIEGGADLHSVWAVPRAAIVATDPDDLIWRYTDQTYRLARGYSKEVRDKWERIREKRALEAYERDDLKETF